MITALNIVSCTIGFLLGLLIAYLVRQKLRANIAELTKMKNILENLLTTINTEHDDLMNHLEGLQRLIVSELKDRRAVEDDKS